MKQELLNSIQTLVEKHQDIALLWETAYRQTEGDLLLAYGIIALLALNSVIFLYLLLFRRRHNKLFVKELKKKVSFILRGNAW